jgi:hypothetical protein
MGYGTVARAVTSHSGHRAATLIVLVALAAVIGPLAATTYDVWRNDALSGTSEAALEDWLQGTDYRILTVSASDGHVSAAISGNGALPAFDQLLADVRRQAGAAVTITVTQYPAVTLEGTT